MKTTVLMENATCSSKYQAEHGLSLFVETGHQKLLFDMGATDAFLRNARALGVDVTEADAAFVSHGHYDHGGGLGAYLALGGNAPVYLTKGAFAPHMSLSSDGSLHDIGLDPTLAKSERIIFVDDFLRINEHLLLFSHVAQTELAPESNATLLELLPQDGEEDAKGAGDAGAYAPDPFAHEQSLIIEEDGRHVLITGCSHCGIVNIIKRAEEIIGQPLYAVIAGFHLMSPADGKNGNLDYAADVAAFLKTRPTRYYTFHCTGLAAYSVLRDTLGDRVNYLYTGATLEL